MPVSFRRKANLAAASTSDHFSACSFRRMANFMRIVYLENEQQALMANFMSSKPYVPVSFRRMVI